jgi:iron complex transport system ATP-binding protein
MLSFIEVSSGYNNTEVLKDITFDIKEGSFSGIIGPNGSGKTTLLKTAVKIIKPFKGEIYIQKALLNKVSLLELAKIIAVVPQDTVFLLPFRVIDVVLMGRIPYLNRFSVESIDDMKIAYKALEEVDAFHLKDRFIDELSGGERQRIIIAKALAQQPKILFLDEPTMHLDISHQTEIFGLLNRLNKETGLTIIAVLHDLNLASEYCDELLLINEGRLIKKGLPKDVLKYNIIEEVYKTVVIVKDNPLTLKPHIFLVKKE